MTITYTLDELPEIALKIIKSTQHKNLLFYGEMGSGKTTLIKTLIKQLGVNDYVSSPTFSLVNEYLSAKNETIYHFDFYRIEQEEEALDIGIEDYFDKNAWCFIEWPENVENLLPLNALSIQIQILDEFTRKIEWLD
jgi:tRNA threonylcarbamoyladenosine biosynthesis protein TsaE